LHFAFLFIFQVATIETKDLFSFSEPPRSRFSHFNAKICIKLWPVVSLAEKHKNTIDEAAARLLARAENARALETADLAPRLTRAVEKYVLKANEKAGAQEIKQFIDEIRADDFCLVMACEKGDEQAWEDLVKNFDAVVKSAARRISGNAEEAEDLASSIWAELYGLREGKSKLAYFSGRGSLAGWLRAVTNQLAIDGFRKMKRLVQVEETREFENMAQDSAGKTENERVIAHTENPEEIFSEREAARDVANALKEAIAELQPEDRLILKLYYFDDLKLKDIGATLGFHEATASRKLARLQTEIRKSVEKILMKQRGWTEDEVKRHLSDAASRLGVNLEKMFAVLIVLSLVQEFIERGVL
jgi:RNA polymerase sigma-70 factor (ECF subfamily)